MLERNLYGSGSTHLIIPAAAQCPAVPYSSLMFCNLHFVTKLFHWNLFSKVIYSHYEKRDHLQQPITLEMHLHELVGVLSLKKCEPSPNFKLPTPHLLTLAVAPGPCALWELEGLCCMRSSRGGTGGSCDTGDGGRSTCTQTQNKEMTHGNE